MKFACGRRLTYVLKQRVVNEVRKEEVSRDFVISLHPAIQYATFRISRTVGSSVAHYIEAQRTAVFSNTASKLP